MKEFISKWNKAISEKLGFNVLNGLAVTLFFVGIAMLWSYDTSSHPGADQSVMEAPASIDGVE